jgi:hypothetical protein
MSFDSTSCSKTCAWEGVDVPHEQVINSYCEGKGLGESRLRS